MIGAGVELVFMRHVSERGTPDRESSGNGEAKGWELKHLVLFRKQEVIHRMWGAAEDETEDRILLALFGW